MDNEEYITPNRYAIINKSYSQKVYYYIKMGHIDVNEHGLVKKDFPFPKDLKSGRPKEYE